MVSLDYLMFVFMGHCAIIARYIIAKWDIAQVCSGETKYQGGIAPFWGHANLSYKVSCDMGIASTISRFGGLESLDSLEFLRDRPFERHRNSEGFVNCGFQTAVRVFWRSNCATPHFTPFNLVWTCNRGPLNGGFQTMVRVFVGRSAQRTLGYSFYYPITRGTESLGYSNFTRGTDSLHWDSFLAGETQKYYTVCGWWGQICYPKDSESLLS